MLTRRAAALLLAALLLAGCTKGPQETKEAPDQSAYAGGTGIAVALTNAAQGTFEVTVVVVASDGHVADQLNATLSTGDTAEKWWGLDARQYTVRMAYQWNAESGRSASGGDAQTIDLRDCAELTRLGWEFRQQGDMVGNAYLGKACVTAG